MLLLLDCVVVNFPRLCRHHFQPDPTDLLPVESSHGFPGCLSLTEQRVAAPLAGEEVKINQSSEPAEDVLHRVYRRLSWAGYDEESLHDGTLRVSQRLGRGQGDAAVGRVVEILLLLGRGRRTEVEVPHHVGGLEDGLVSDVVWRCGG